MHVDRLTALLLLVPLWLSGCEAAPPPSADAEPPPPSVEDLAREQANRLAEALQARPAAPPDGTANPPADTPPQVRWINPDRGGHTVTLTAVRTVEPEASRPTQVQQPAPAQTLTRAELLDQLRQRIADAADPAVTRALDAAHLSLLSRTAPDPTVLEALDPSQRRAVMLYHELAAALAHQVQASGGAFDADMAHAELIQVFGRLPLRIRHIELCKRVRGFGVYDPFEERTFIAGRENPMIVYVEVDHFRSVPSGDQFTVRLRQEVVLYNHADGLAVWRQSPVEIVDESRNQRRDFFVVQMVRLPANLSVGKYLLKVSVTDQAGGSVDEEAVAINIVAGDTMVTRPR